jgi:hypothetical protein
MNKGLFKWLAMPFKLTDALDTFMYDITQVPKHFLDKYVVVYFNDILIFSNYLHDHLAYIK